MAERLQEFPGKKASRRYPWDDWCDGSAWRLFRGVDFDAEVDQFRNRMYAQANRRNLGVHTSKDVVMKDGQEVEILDIVFYDLDDEPSVNGAGG